LLAEVTVMNTLTVNLHLLMVLCFINLQKLDIKLFGEGESIFGSIHVSESSRFSFAKRWLSHPEDAPLIEIKRREGEITNI
jgi:hypothetical protein